MQSSNIVAYPAFKINIAGFEKEWIFPVTTKYVLETGSFPDNVVRRY